MPHHFTKNTLETTKWCNRCGRSTQWLVSDGRLGRCKEDHPPKHPQAKPAAASTQQSLFDPEPSK